MMVKMRVLCNLKRYFLRSRAGDAWKFQPENWSKLYPMQNLQRTCSTFWSIPPPFSLPFSSIMPRSMSVTCHQMTLRRLLVRLDARCFGSLAFFACPKREGPKPPLSPMTGRERPSSNTQSNAPTMTKAATSLALLALGVSDICHAQQQEDGAGRIGGGGPLNLIRKAAQAQPGGVASAATQHTVRNLQDGSEIGTSDESQIQKLRDLYELQILFTECEGKTPDECQQIIQSVYTKAKSFEIRHKRTRDDPGYNKVVIVPDATGTNAVGLYGDGIHKYPFPWVINGEEFEIGPWDCDVGTPLTIDECCDMILASVPAVDDRGNHLECSVLPLEFINPPHDSSKVIMTVDPNTGLIASDKLPVVN